MDIICSSVSLPRASFRNHQNLGAILERQNDDLGVFESRFYCFCFVLYFSVGEEKREEREK
jgi:hypothetical protein